MATVRLHLQITVSVINTCAANPSTLCPRGMNAVSIKLNSACATSASYKAGVSFFLARRCFSARSACQKQSWCFASGQVARIALISDQSLSVSVNSGWTPRALSCPKNCSRTACLAPERASFDVRISKNAKGMPDPFTSATAENSSKLPPLVFPTSITKLVSAFFCKCTYKLSPWQALVCAWPIPS